LDRISYSQTPCSLVSGGRIPEGAHIVRTFSGMRTGAATAMNPVFPNATSRAQQIGRAQRYGRRAGAFHQLPTLELIGALENPLRRCIWPHATERSCGRSFLICELPNLMTALLRAVWPPFPGVGARRPCATLEQKTPAEEAAYPTVPVKSLGPPIHELWSVARAPSVSGQQLRQFSNRAAYKPIRQATRFIGRSVGRCCTFKGKTPRGFLVDESTS
jgi:hypothetical protein